MRDDPNQLEHTRENCDVTHEALNVILGHRVDAFYPAVRPDLERLRRYPTTVRSLCLLCTTATDSGQRCPSLQCILDDTGQQVAERAAATKAARFATKANKWRSDADERNKARHEAVKLAMVSACTAQPTISDHARGLHTRNETPTSYYDRGVHWKKGVMEKRKTKAERLALDNAAELQESLGQHKQWMQKKNSANEALLARAQVRHGVRWSSPPPTTTQQRSRHNNATRALNVGQHESHAPLLCHQSVAMTSALEPLWVRLRLDEERRRSEAEERREQVEARELDSVRQSPLRVVQRPETYMADLTRRLTYEERDIGTDPNLTFRPAIREYIPPPHATSSTRAATAYSACRTCRPSTTASPTKASRQRITPQRFAEFMDRTTEWSLQHDARMGLLQRERDSLVLQECTHQPHITTKAHRLSEVAWTTAKSDNSSRRGHPSPRITPIRRDNRPLSLSSPSRTRPPTTQGSYSPHNRQTKRRTVEAFIPKAMEVRHDHSTHVDIGGMQSDDEIDSLREWFDRMHRWNHDGTGVTWRQSVEALKQLAATVRTDEAYAPRVEFDVLRAEQRITFPEFVFLYRRWFS